VAYDTYQKTVGALCSCDAKQAGSQYVNQDKLVCAVDVRNSKDDIVNGALQSMASNNLNSNNVVRTQYAVRRLTPTECERLQGLPDGYTLIDDKSCSDSARYKALGNGMAQPCADFVIRRIVEEVSKDEVQG
jgi:DNA (cytosine-5)-methyltransferase 1